MCSTWFKRYGSYVTDKHISTLVSSKFVDFKAQLGELLRNRSPLYHEAMYIANSEIKALWEKGL